MDQVVRVATAHSETAGINADDVATCERWLRLGYRIIAYSGDFRLLTAGLRDGIARVRALG